MRCTEFTTSMPLLRIQYRGATTSSLNAPAGALITPTYEGANVIAARFDIDDVEASRRISVCAEFHESGELDDMSDAWQTVEEVDIETDGPLEITDATGRRLDAPSEAIEDARGLLRIRVAARGRASTRPAVQIDVRPVRFAAELRQLRHTDGIDISQFSPPPPAGDPSSRRERNVVSTSKLSATAPSSVIQRWNELVAVLRTRELSSLADSLAGAAKTVESDADDHEHRTWFALVAEVDLQGRRSLLPGVDLVPEASSQSIRSAWLQMWESVDNTEIPPSIAAVSAHRFREEFVPVAERDSCALVVDTRPGEFTGCVTVYDNVAADDSGPYFRSVSAMLHDLAHAIDSGTAFIGALPSIDDGHLIWDLG